MKSGGVQILIVGSLPWFADSFRIFPEAGVRGAYVRLTQAPIPTFQNSYGLLKDAGFQDIAFDLAAIKAFLKAGDFTLIISGGELIAQGTYFYGGDSLAKLRAFGEVCRIAKQSDAPTLKVRFFNGETYFINADIATQVVESLSAADLMLFDNKPLADYVFHNCPRLQDIPHVIAQVETPLQRFMRSAVGLPILPYILLLGRWPGSSVSFTKVNWRTRIVSRTKRALGRGPFVRVPGYGWHGPQGHADQVATAGSALLPLSVIGSRRQVASASNLTKLDHERRHLFTERAACIAGLSHFYEFPQIYSPARSDEERFGFFQQRHTVANAFGYSWPAVMRRINISSKAITYLMLGIPPVVPDDPDQPLTTMLKARNMCVAVGPNTNWCEELMSETAINLKRRAVAEHASDLTFERVIERLNEACRIRFGGNIISFPREASSAESADDSTCAQNTGALPHG